MHGEAAPLSTRVLLIQLFLCFHVIVTRAGGRWVVVVTGTVRQVRATSTGTLYVCMCGRAQFLGILLRAAERLARNGKLPSRKI